MFLLHRSIAALAHKWSCELFVISSEQTNLFQAALAGLPVFSKEARPDRPDRTGDFPRVTLGLRSRVVVCG